MRRSPRRLLLALHMYLGLACSGYLVVYGLSTFAFNHPWDVFAPSQEEVTWETTIAPLDAAGADGEVAARARTALGLIGFTPPWLVERAGDGTFAFTITRPGRHYRVHVAPDGSARVRETRRGLWDVLKAVHGLGYLPGSAWAVTWGVYTNLSVLALCVSSLSGAAMVLGRRSARRRGLIVLGVASAGSLALALAVWW